MHPTQYHENRRRVPKQRAKGVRKEMTCKDCYHNKVCKYKNYQIPLCDCTYEESNHVENIGCPLVCKASVIEVPCKVGDTVYTFQDDFGVVLPFFVEQIIIGYDEKEPNVTITANCYNDENKELLADIDFEPKDIGVSVFLTEKEAKTENY